jgi:hypothetical protein
MNNTANNINATASANITHFDNNVLRFNQIAIVAFTLLAMGLSQWPIVAITALIMLIGSSKPELALFKQLYLKLLRPALKIAPQLQPDDPRPHAFAQSVGGVVLLCSALAWALGGPLLGWLLAALVVALALLNLLAGVCVGCFLYFQLRQWQYRLAR